MALTLNQVIARLETLALSHRLINHFYFGHPGQWLANGDVVYPACFLDMDTGSISKENKQTGWDFDIWFADLANVAQDTKRNELDLQSDLTSIAEDYKSMLSYSGYQRDWDIEEEAPLKYWREEKEDVLIAVSMRQRIKVRFDSNRCDVPANDVEFEENKNSVMVNTYRYTGTGTEGNALTIATLQNKTILLLVKGLNPITPVADDADTPDENQYKFNSQTGYLQFGTDIEPLQKIQIIYR